MVDSRTRVFRDNALPRVVAKVLEAQMDHRYVDDADTLQVFNEIARHLSAAEDGQGWKTIGTLRCVSKTLSGLQFGPKLVIRDISLRAFCRVMRNVTHLWELSVTFPKIYRGPNVFAKRSITPLVGVRRLTLVNVGEECALHVVKRAILGSASSIEHLSFELSSLSFWWIREETAPPLVSTVLQQPLPKLALFHCSKLKIDGIKHLLRLFTWIPCGAKVSGMDVSLIPPNDANLNDATPDPSLLTAFGGWKDASFSSVDMVVCPLYMELLTALLKTAPPPIVHILVVTTGVPLPDDAAGIEADVSPRHMASRRFFAALEEAPLEELYFHNARSEGSPIYGNDQSDMHSALLFIPRTSSCAVFGYLSEDRNNVPPLVPTSRLLNYPNLRTIALCDASITCDADTHMSLDIVSSFAAVAGQRNLAFAFNFDMYLHIATDNMDGDSGDRIRAVLHRQETGVQELFIEINSVVAFKDKEVCYDYAEDMTFGCRHDSKGMVSQHVERGPLSQRLPTAAATRPSAFLVFAACRSTAEWRSASPPIGFATRFLLSRSRIFPHTFFEACARTSGQRGCEF